MNPREIRQLWEFGQAQWSSFSLSEEQLLAFSSGGAREASAPLNEGLAQDLYLACACSLGLEAAVCSFDERHRADIDRALGPMALPQDLREEIKQAIRTKLFVSQGNRVSAIQKYSGRGSLAGWVRAVAVRTAIDILRKEKSDEIAVDLPVLESLAEVDLDPDLRAMKNKHRELVNAAFESGFTQLSVRQRNLLRQHYIHQLNIEQLGAMYKVHRATAFRWVAKARTDVFRSAREHVADVLGEDPESAEELLRLLQSQVDVSLDRLLRTEAA